MRKPIKPPRKRRAVDLAHVAPLVERRTPRPATSDPVEGRVSTNKGKQYVDHMMNLNKHYDDKVRCYIYFQSYVNFKRAEEWARYWQPRLGTPIGLVIEKTLERVTIDHGTEDDPFPRREFDYPWKAEAGEYKARNSRQWANDATLKARQPEPESEPAVVPPSKPPQAAQPPARRSLPDKPATPPSTARKPATAVPAKPPAPTPRRVVPTPPNHKRR